jgi:nucleoside-diphosphate-sugar epimerase
VTGSLIVVTGAGGFIGGEVARTLACQPGLEVRGGTRDGRELAASITPCRLDVCDPASLTAALRGADAVIHCAVGDRKTTVEGTRLLLQAAATGGIRRVVHLSSIAVYGEAKGTVDESVALVSPEGRGYAHWKVAAEAACRDAAHGGMQVIMLRPAIVYGPGSDDWVTRPARRLLSGGWGALGDVGAGICNLVHVRDVAAACAAALFSSATAGECAAFNISGRETITWSAWYARLAEALGLPVLRKMSAASWRRRSIAALPFKALARLRPDAGKLFERITLLAPASSELTLFGLAATYPTDKAARQLGWQPRVTLQEGLADSVAWLRSAGLAP